jgi:hypothetical protein
MGCRSGRACWRPRVQWAWCRCVVLSPFPPTSPHPLLFFVHRTILRHHLRNRACVLAVMLQLRGRPPDAAAVRSAVDTTFGEVAEGGAGTSVSQRSLVLDRGAHASTARSAYASAPWAGLASTSPPASSRTQGVVEWRASAAAAQRLAAAQAAATGATWPRTSAGSHLGPLDTRRDRVSVQQQRQASPPDPGADVWSPSSTAVGALRFVPSPVFSLYIGFIP